MLIKEINRAIRLVTKQGSETENLDDENVRTLLKAYKTGNLVSDELLPLCVFEPELFVDIEINENNYEFRFCLDCDAVEILRNNKPGELANFSPARIFIHGLAERYFDYVSPYAPDH